MIVLHCQNVLILGRIDLGLPSIEFWRQILAISTPQREMMIANNEA